MEENKISKITINNPDSSIYVKNRVIYTDIKDNNHFFIDISTQQKIILVNENKKYVVDKQKLIDVMLNCGILSSN